MGQKYLTPKIGKLGNGACVHLDIGPDWDRYGDNHLTALEAEALAKELNDMARQVRAKNKARMP